MYYLTTITNGHHTDSQHGVKERLERFKLNLILGFFPPFSLVVSLFLVCDQRATAIPQVAQRLWSEEHEQVTLIVNLVRETDTIVKSHDFLNFARPGIKPMLGTI